MTQNNLIPQLYNAIDSKDTSNVVRNMTTDSIFRYANLPPVEGIENISVFLDRFFQSIKAIHHTDLEYWNKEDVIFVTGNANYTRHNDTRLTVPFGVLLRMNKDLIKEWLVFVDNSELYR